MIKGNTQYSIIPLFRNLERQYKLQNQPEKQNGHLITN